MRILEIEIESSNLKKDELFYDKILQLELLEKKMDSVTFRVGSSKLTFRESNKEDIQHHFAFNIPNNRLNEAIQWLSSRLNLIKNSNDSPITHFESWNAKSVYFYDYNLNILEFIARSDLHNSSLKPFDNSSILAISEIGIIAEKPLSLAEELVNKYQLDYFEKGPKRENFVVLGDDNGLIVISEKGRHWFPTNHPASKQTVKVKLQNIDRIIEFTTK